tara:strand:- start:10 stop:486 length:477 start_codon:yes stop_codon:yes gene_type:complete
LGFLTFPEGVENFYLSSLGSSWVEEPVFYEEFQEMYAYESMEFKKLPKKNFMIFFTTELEGQQHDGWEQVMMAVGHITHSKKFGTFITVKAIFRYGFGVKDIFTLNDVVSEIEKYFPVGIEHLDTANAENIYYTYVGMVSNFPDLTTHIASALKEAKF